MNVETMSYASRQPLVDINVKIGMNSNASCCQSTKISIQRNDPLQAFQNNYKDLKRRNTVRGELTLSKKRKLNKGNDDESEVEFTKDNNSYKDDQLTNLPTLRRNRQAVSDKFRRLSLQISPKIDAIEEDVSYKGCNGPNRFICKWCGKKERIDFQHSISLHSRFCAKRQEIEDKKQNEVFVCKNKKCGLAFLSSKSLQSHAPKCKFSSFSYRNLRAYQCPICPEEFISSDELLKHSFIPHENVKIKNAQKKSWPEPLCIQNKGFGCNICGQLYASSFRLQKHKDTSH